jgi:ABC-2 type transport system permease protein
VKRIRCLLIKELAQLRRDPKLLRILLLAPLIQLLVLGHAANTDVREIALAIRDDDRSFHSREYCRALGASGYFKVTMLTGPEGEDDRALVGSRAGLVLKIPPDFGRRLAGGEPAPVQALVDGSDSNFGVQGMNYLQRASRLHSRGLVRVAMETFQRATGRTVPGVEAEVRVWYNPDLRSRYYMVPAVMGVLLLVTTMIVTSMALVKEREEGTMEQLIVTPLRPGELIAGKLLPFAGIGFGMVTLALPVMLLIFGVPFRGSILLLYALVALFLLNTLGLGLFISTLVRTQQQAMMLATFFVMMPFVLLSGFIFPVENMPPLIQVLAEFIPLRHFLTIIRGLFLKGVGMAELWPPALALLGWGTAILALAILKSRKRLD